MYEGIYEKEIMMYEPYDLPYPDPDAYLARIGITERPEPTAENLDRLVYAHLTHVPFEDLNQSLFGRPISLKTADLFEKIVVQKRGGYCFEQNMAFRRLLKDLGYDSEPVYARVLWADDPMPPVSHCAILTRIEGEDFYRYRDVGFGGPAPAGTIPVIPDTETAVCGETWLLKRHESGWMDLSLKKPDGTVEPEIRFCPNRTVPQDFIAPNYYLSESPESPFKQFIMVNLRTETGSLALTVDKLTVREGGEVTEIEVPDRDALFAVLEKYYGMTFEN